MTEADRRVRFCQPCQVTWRGNVPCLFCGGSGVTGAEATAMHPQEREVSWW